MAAASRRRWGAALALVCTLVAAALAAVAFAPLPPAAREALVEIPKGTYARRMAGDKTEVLPDTIELTLGVRNVLHLRNLDDVPQVFGPTLIMPGQSFRLPFETASTYSFACTAHASGQMSVVVHPAPEGWAALQSRARQWLQKAWA